MKELKNKQSLESILEEEQQGVTQTNNDTRRNFIKKFGKLALVTPIGVTALMTPKTSKAMNSDTGPSDII
ncbi:hypothetical protein RI844_09760 [Thalassotalea fonticola]|uniref:Twin-arginine translocation signal domain-containing protein n=1 Tax=Thalassotalea fonticola TaxID=3065649 RepID=A0ABZ0GW32_9GAMM|nr:hypothetical protein RI844_09760 [Colwelliaceae bacterium S1-1]